MKRDLELKTSDGGAITVPFKSTGTTPIWFKQFAGEDLVASINDATGNISKSSDVYSRLAYVMHRQAIAKSLDELSDLDIDGFYAWLDQFEPMTFANKSDEIVDIYLCNTETSSDAKKNPDQQTDQ